MSRSLVLITESHFSWLWLIIFTLFHFCRPPRRHFNKLKQKPLARNFTFTARSQRRFKSGDMAVARFHDRRKFLLGHKWPPNNSDIASRNPFEKTPLSNLPIYQLLLLQQRRNCNCWTLETLLSVMTAKPSNLFMPMRFSYRRRRKEFIHNGSWFSCVCPVGLQNKLQILLFISQFFNNIETFTVFF